MQLMFCILPSRANVEEFDWNGKHIFMSEEHGKSILVRGKSVSQMTLHRNTKIDALRVIAGSFSAVWDLMFRDNPWFWMKFAYKTDGFFISFEASPNYRPISIRILKHHQMTNVQIHVKNLIQDSSPRNLYFMFREFPVSPWVIFKGLRRFSRKKWQTIRIVGTEINLIVSHSV
jgi:hypothetical protein